MSFPTPGEDVREPEVAVELGRECAVVRFYARRTDGEVAYRTISVTRELIRDAVPGAVGALLEQALREIADLAWPPEGEANDG